MNFATYGDTLTDREMQVLFALADGATAIEIAAELYLSAETVRSHTSALRRKLGAKTTTHAVALAYHCGLLTPMRAAA